MTPPTPPPAPLGPDPRAADVVRLLDTIGMDALVEIGREVAESLAQELTP